LLVFERKERILEVIHCHWNARDRREIDYGLAVPITLANEYILNTGTVDEALDAFGEIIDRHTAT
jgi:hypothetical protein